MTKSFYATVSVAVISIFITTKVFAQKPITIEGIWKDYEFYPAAPDGFTPLNDGEHYAKVENDSKDKPAIYSFEYLTGVKASTIFSVSENVPSDSARKFSSLDYFFDKNQEHILFSTDEEKIYRRGSVASYFVFDIKSKKLSALSEKGKQMSPAFSPDGKKIAFVRDNNIFIKDLESGEEKQVTTDGKKNFIINGICDWVYEEEFSFVQAFQWSNDSKHLAYYHFDETAVPEYTVQFYNDLYPENYSYKYPKAGEKNSIVQIHIYNTETGLNVLADIGPETDQYIPRIKWTNDDNVLCITRMNRLQNKLELLLADASTGKTSVMMKEEDPDYINITDDLTFFKDNSQFIWTTSGREGYNHIYIYGMDGKMKTEVTHGNWDVTAFYGLDEKNGLIYYQSAEESPMRRYVYSIKLDGTDEKKLTNDAGTNSAEFNPTFSYFLRTHSDANTPPDYAICNSNGDLIKVVENNDALKKKLVDYGVSKKEFFSFSLDDGTVLNGWMIKPKDFSEKKKYPVLMHVYGGPGSQQVLDSYDPFYYMNFNYLAQHGYIIACVDNRGTGARGSSFEKITYMQLGRIETMDQAAGAKYLGSLKYVDPTRIGISGWSYGGFMSLMCLSYYPDIFKTAVSVAPVTSWKFYDSIYTERYMRAPAQNKEGYEKFCPLAGAQFIKGKLLICHGLADDNVHYQNTAELLKMLYANNIKFTQMTFPDKNHGINGGNTRNYLFSNMYDWVITNL
ncbi:MAG TPA: S9 family peptidase [Bacteroidetes bacterium]|nr:S9 family peptidase [Bacteroidota bacterium]